MKSFLIYVILYLRYTFGGNLIMNRLVYLHELDSVRNSKQEIFVGQRALYNEIVKNGNKVVLTLNQLTDSLAFLSLVRDPKIYPSILQLFATGTLKVSLYGELKTASQYIQQSIDKCLEDPQEKNDSTEVFIFSGLPVKSDDEEMLTTIKNALQYSDLSELESMIDELKEKNPEKNKEQIEKLDYLLRFVSMILKLSVQNTSNNPKKATSMRSFYEFMEIMMELLKQIPFENTEISQYMDEALALLSKINLSDNDKNDRSNWIMNLDKQSTDSHETEPIVKKLALAIIYVCYNYTLEDSIQSVSKHYDDEDFIKTFRKDLKSRLENYWMLSRDIIHNPDNDTDISHIKCCALNWNAAARISVYNSNNPIHIDIYENSFNEEQRRWHKRALRKTLSALFLTVMHIVIFCIIDFLLGLVENGFSELTKSIKWSTILSIIIFGVTSSIISSAGNIPDILDSMKNIALYSYDYFLIAYRNINNIQ